MYFLHFPDKLMKLDYVGNKNSSMLRLIMGILTLLKCWTNNIEDEIVF